MSYATQAALTFDSQFRDRTITASKEQALVFKDDQRPAFHDLAWAVIHDPSTANGVFELVVVSPTFADVEDASTITDADLLAAVQAVWPTYGSVVGNEHTPPPAE